MVESLTDEQFTEMVGQANAVFECRAEDATQFADDILQKVMDAQDADGSLRYTTSVLSLANTLKQTLFTPVFGMMEDEAIYELVRNAEYLICIKYALDNKDTKKS